MGLKTSGKGDTLLSAKRGQILRNPHKSTPAPELAGEPRHAAIAPSRRPLRSTLVDCQQLDKRLLILCKQYPISNKAK